MRFLAPFLLFVSSVWAAPRSLSCVGITPQLTHDGQAFQIHAPMIEGANVVDAHIALDGATDVMNYRLIPSSTQAGTYELPLPITGHENSAISFHLTYMSPSNPACDTVQFGTVTNPRPSRSSASALASAPASAPASAAPAPAQTQAQAQAQTQAPAEADAASHESVTCSLPPIQHQVMRNDAGQYFVQVVSNEPYSYVDLHSTIGSSPETNIRIGTNVATSQSSPMTIATGEGLTYWLTYAAGDVACSTGMFGTGPLN